MSDGWDNITTDHRKYDSSIMLVGTPQYSLTLFFNKSTNLQGSWQPQRHLVTGRMLDPEEGSRQASSDLSYWKEWWHFFNCKGHPLLGYGWGMQIPSLLHAFHQEVAGHDQKYNYHRTKNLPGLLMEMPAIQNTNLEFIICIVIEPNTTRTLQCRSIKSSMYVILVSKCP